VRKAKRTWVYAPPKPAKLKVQDTVNARIQERAQEFLEKVVHPMQVKAYLEQSCV
jgi:hypothetical protein